MLAALAAGLAVCTPLLAQSTPAGGGVAQHTPPPPRAGAQPGPAVTIPVPVLLLVPLEFRDDPNMGNGCWVRLFNGTNFKGKDELTVVGPVELRSLKMPSGINWKRKADSLIAGPKATVTVYENEFFKDKTVTYQPGQKVENLRKDLGILHAIDSLKIACASK